MRRATAILATFLVGVSCGGSAPSAAGSTHPSPRASASASPPAKGTLGGAYGMLIVGSELRLVKPDASIFATAPMTLQGVDCSAQHDAVNLQPPVSATTDQVFFRDGAKIRMVTPPTGAVDVTTVPNSQTQVSFFSVSPDDKRIAVVVMDVSSASAINLRLYVEDLRGAGNHLDIYSTSVTRSKTATTLWPMGWHQGLLVLAVVQACTFEPVGLHPSEWHISNATTAVRVTTITGINCQLGNAPSPAGVGCADPNGVTTLFDWSNKVLGVTRAPGTGFAGLDTGLSPKGQSIFFATTGLAPPASAVVELGSGPYATVPNHSACAWIDEDHVLTPDAVIAFPAETPGNVQVNATVLPLGQAGVCAGRFPGDL